MSRRRRVQSELDQALERCGVSPSGGRVGVLRGLTPEQFEEFRKLQRIGTRDPQSRAKLERRLGRVEARHNREHAFLKGERFQEYPDWYKDNPTRHDALSELETSYWSGKYGVQSGRPLSLIIEDLRGFRKSDKSFRDHFDDYEIDHVIRLLTLRTLKASKLGSR